MVKKLHPWLARPVCSCILGTYTLVIMFVLQLSVGQYAFHCVVTRWNPERAKLRSYVHTYIVLAQFSQNKSTHLAASGVDVMITIFCDF
jgi:hypothetical protein